MEKLHKDKVLDKGNLKIVFSEAWWKENLLTEIVRKKYIDFIKKNIPKNILVNVYFIILLFGYLLFNVFLTTTKNTVIAGKKLFSNNKCNRKKTFPIVYNLSNS